MMRRTQLNEVGRYAWQWFRKAGDMFRERGIYPMDLSDFYGDEDDMVVAGILDMLLPGGTNRQSYQIEVRNMIGDKPSAMVRDRSFVTMLETGVDDMSILDNHFLTRHSITTLMDWMWEVFYRDMYNPEHVLTYEMRGKGDGWTRLSDVLDINQERLAKLVRFVAKMTMKDGYGKGMWKSVPVESLPCPCDKGMSRVVHWFYPLEAVTPENIDEILYYMGFDVPAEAVYSYWAIRHMEKTMPDALNYFLKSFRDHTKVDNLLRWCCGTSYYRNKLMGELPEIIL